MALRHFENNQALHQARLHRSTRLQQHRRQQQELLTPSSSQTHTTPIIIRADYRVNQKVGVLEWSPRTANDEKQCRTLGPIQPGA
jgi:hypothetical protein